MQNYSYTVHPGEIALTEDTILSVCSWRLTRRCNDCDWYQISISDTTIQVDMLANAMEMASSLCRAKSACTLAQFPVCLSHIGTIVHLLSVYFYDRPLYASYCLHYSTQNWNTVLWSRVISVKSWSRGRGHERVITHYQCWGGLNFIANTHQWGGNGK